MAKTKLIGYGSLTTITAILLWIAFNQSFILNASGDITCAGVPKYSELFKVNISDCQVFWNITSINYTYYFRNKEGIKLGFSPEVKGYEIFVKDGRYNSGWKLLDKSGNFTYKKGIKYQFMAFIFKDYNQTVKWTITAADVTKDPILFGINITVIQDCTTETIENSVNIYEDRINIINGTKCFDEPFNLTCSLFNYRNTTTPIKTGTYIEYLNYTTCTNIGLQVNNKKIIPRNYNLKCTRDNLILTCVNVYDGNSGCVFDLSTMKLVDSCRFDSKGSHMKTLEAE